MKQVLDRADIRFALLCALAYAVVVLIVPPYTPLLEPDSAGYVDFSPMRPALYPAFLSTLRAAGLGLVQITWVQLAIFAAALVYLLVVLQRCGFSKLLLALLVAVLAANVLYSSFHRSILTESVYFSGSLVALALWIDYLRSPTVPRLIGAGLALGFVLGIRLAGLGIVPLHIVIVWLRRPPSVRLWVALLLTVLPLAAGLVTERVVYFAAHGSRGESQAPHLLMGKAAMLIKPGMTFSGPHAETLAVLGAQLAAIYAPLQRYVDDAPSWAVGAYLSAFYEGAAAYDVMSREIDEAAARQRTSAAILRTELGKQVILQNPVGYMKLTLLNELGQWSIAAPRFPANARAVAAYADANPGIAFEGRLPSTLLHPQPSLTGLMVYPAFLIAGGVTLVLGFGFIVFLVRPSLADGPAGFYLLVATYLSAMCHAYTLFISLVDEWTPRFLMAVFPQLEIIALCLIVLLMGRRKMGVSV